MNSLIKPVQALSILSSLLLSPLGTIKATEAPPKPNIVIFLADDIGIEGLGCYGGTRFQEVATHEDLGPVVTPNLDAMAQKGMRFANCFSTPICSPSRAQMLTGRYSYRIGFTDIIGRNGATLELDQKAYPTMATLLKSAGYVTAVAGKWHIGPPHSMADLGDIPYTAAQLGLPNHEPEIPMTADKDTNYAHPRECGFDRQCVFAGGHLERYGKPTPKDYTPARIQDWVLRFLESRKGKKEPFFLYYASPLPHDPHRPTPLNSKFVNRPGPYSHSDPKNFPFLVEYLDQQVGELARKLDSLGLSKNTLVLFCGDNGTYGKIATEMGDGRVIPGGKGTVKDTGSWVPLLARWPGVIQASTVNRNLVDFSDFLPTCLELAGVKPPEGIDGISFASQLLGKPGPVRKWVSSYIINVYFVRNTKWKLHDNGRLEDISNSPYEEKLVRPQDDTAESRAARIALGAVLDKLHPERKNKLKKTQPKVALTPIPDDSD